VGVGLDNAFVADEAVVSAIASQQFTGGRHDRFALVDLGLGMADRPGTGSTPGWCPKAFVKRR
jgi:hypothetical protein